MVKKKLLKRTGYGIGGDCWTYCISGFSCSHQSQDPTEQGRCISKAHGGDGLNHVLVPHSISGLESVYWAQKYPNEVSAIIGIDVGTVNAYFDPNLPKASDFVTKIKILAFAEHMGVTRFIPSMVESEAAISAGSLTEQEKDIYKAIYYRRTNTPPMVQELVQLLDNAHKVDALPPPQIPVMLFISNGDGIGLGYTKEQWQGFQLSYLSRIANSKYVLMDDYGHYLQDFAPDVLAQKIKAFIPAN
ncbi:alpha/beta hydrolase [Paenibacillus sp. CF384]|uniref:alpha/beta hydrolase n=1 Tax=Paenibacillus sp. CF384 TaxID=1884382 RepID=UPI00089AA401|nr:alpha/beta hydrolase [Paenibacillus sp. CF384]SDW08850.1 hypothetical protein SAMN05518855_1001222 [Paenibacillus sp. CF384]